MRVEMDASSVDEMEPPQPAVPTDASITSTTNKSTVSSLDDCTDSSLDASAQILPSALTSPDRALLAKLEEANKLIEADAKSVLSGHSRKGSDASSQASITSGGDAVGGAGGKETPCDQNCSYTIEPNSEENHGLCEEELWAQWGCLVNNWELEWKKNNQMIKNLVRQGVPHHFRGIVWPLLAGVDTSPDRSDKKLYASYIKAKSACEKMIRRDIARTYPEHEFFKKKDGLGQESLFNVMKAYSLHDREVGYCQGSGFIVGLLLMRMPEEDAFAVLVKIMQQHRMRDMFKPSMAELGLCMFQLENLVSELIPDLHVHFQAQNFHTTIYASSWFLTLFATTLSLKLACRIMDVFLLEGIEIVFKVALALLYIVKNDLLSLDMEAMLRYMRHELPQKAEVDHDSLMNLAYSIKVNPKKMKKLEKEYTVTKTKEQEDTAVLRCLKQENRLLKQRVELLEKESSALAERLVRGQVDRAEGDEVTFALERELTALRRAHLDAQQRLAVAHDEIRSLEMTIAEQNASVQSSLESNSEAGTSKEPGAGDNIIITPNITNKAPTDKSAARGEELASCLQRELIRARMDAAEKEAAEREMKARLAELEAENQTLRKQRVENNVAHLQDELIAVRMREAEANLSLKELGQRVAELSECWNRHLQEQRQEAAASVTAAPSSPSMVSDFMAKPKRLFRAFEGRSADVQKLEEDLTTAKMSEAKAVVEMTEYKHRVMELEAQVQVSTNQLRRKDEEASELRERLELALDTERSLKNKQKQLINKCTDLETKAQYESMQAKFKIADDAQKIAILKNKVSEYKMKTEVMATEGELRSSMPDDSDRVKELLENVRELQAEVMRLELWKARALARMNPTSSPSPLVEASTPRQPNTDLPYTVAPLTYFSP